MKIIPTGIATANYMRGRTYGSKTYQPKAFVLHWMAGTLAGTDATFRNPLRKASAHFGIGKDGTIHQYVPLSDTAYGAGNWFVNLEAINIEHEGNVGVPITDATYEASADLMAEICRQTGIAPSHETLKAHKEVSLSPTACPGTLDIDRLITMVHERLNPNVLADARIVPVVETCHVTVSSLYLRTSPHVRADNYSLVNGKPDVIKRGGACDYIAVVEGDKALESTNWLLKPDGLYCAAAGTDYKPRSI